jgi:hypothetical protein
MPAKALLTDATVTAMGVIFEKGAKGETWAPRNQDARFQMVKGAPSAPTGRSTYEQLVAKFGEERAKAVKGLWVADGTPDGVDNDNDGAQDYEQILSILFGNLGVPSPYGWDWYCAQGGFINDIQRAMQIGDIEMRSAAIAVGIDNFLEAIDDIRSGGDGAKKAAAIEAYKNGAMTTEKAGARHSKADAEKLNKIKGHAESIVKLHGELSDPKDAPTSGKDGMGEDDAEKAAAVKAIAEWAPSKVAHDGLPENYGDLTALIAKAKADDAKSSEPYGSSDDAGYADPGLQDDKKKRYPLKKNGKFNEKRVRAAWSYINQEKNAAKYSAGDLAKVKKTIEDAAKELDIKIDEADKGAPVTAPGTNADISGVVEMNGERFEVKDGVVIGKAAPEAAPALTADAVAAAVAEAMKAQAGAITETIKASVTEQLAAQAKTVDDRLAAIDDKVTKAAPSPLAATIEAIQAARQPSAPGGVPAMQSDGTFKGNVLTAPTPVEINPSTASVADVVRAARTASQSGTQVRLISA